MQRAKLCLACLLSLAWVVPTSAQTALESNPGYATIQEFSGGVTFQGTYFDVRNMTGDGVGYRNGYTQFGAFMPIWLEEDAFLAPTARLLVTDNSQAGANVGLVYRRYLPSYDRIFGANIYYEGDRSIDEFDYRQVGFGFESLGQRLDFRSNVYLPTDSGEHFVRPLRLGNDPYFFQNRIGFHGVGEYLEAVQGGDFELGVPLTSETPWLRGYAGMYYYDSQGVDPVGFRGRIEAAVSDDLTIGVNVTEDRAFGTNVNAVVDWRFAGWKPTRYFPQWTTRERMLQPVQRNWRIATAAFEKDVNVLALNPATQQPYFVTWIDNSNAAPGTGTFEDPLAAMPDQAPGDLILVRVGNTSSAAPLASSIQLFNNQRLLGEGRAHQFDAYANFAGVLTGGTYTLPGFVDDGNYPWLTSGDNIVSLANGNEVSAFNMIDALGGYAITNTPTGSYGFNLNHLNINGNFGGIFLSNAGGFGQITESNVNNNIAGGIYLDSGSTTLQLLVDNVNASTQGGFQSVGLSINADEGDIIAEITNVNSNRNGTGMILSATNGASLDALIQDVNANNSIGNGIQINGNFGRINVALENVNVNRSGGTGIQAVADNTYFTLSTNGVFANNSTLDNMNLLLSNSTMDVALANSTFNSSDNGSGIVVTNKAGGGVFTANNVTATGNLLDGLVIGVNTFAEVTAAVANSALGNNGRDAISLQGATGAELDIAFQSVLANQSGRDGFHFDFQSDSVLSADLNLMTMTGSGRSAVYGLLDNASADIVLRNFNGSSSGADGLFLQALNESVATVSINRGNLSNSGQFVDPAAAIKIVADNSDVALQVSNTPLNNSFPGGTQDDGLNVAAGNFSNVLINLSDLDISNNADNAMELIADGNTNLQVNLLRINGVDSGGDGIRFTAINNSFLSVTSEDSDFDRSGGNGINGYVNNTSTAVFNFTSTTVSNSGLNGLVVTADNGSAFLSRFESGSFADSGQLLAGPGLQDSINVVGSNFSTIAIDLLQTPTNNNLPNLTQEHGLIAVMSNGSTLIFNNNGGDMSNNLINAMNISLSSGSTGLVTLLNTSGANSGQDGFLFTVDNSSLFANVTNGSFSNAGSLFTNGSGVNGFITNTGLAQLIFTNTDSNNAFDHGMVITATVDSRFEGFFDNSSFDEAGSPFPGFALNPTNAVQLNADDSLIDITMVNGSTGDRAGGDALVITAVNGSQVTGTFIDGSFSDAGQVTNLGVGVNVTADNSYVALDFQSTPTSNTLGGTTQAFGLLFDVQNGSQFFASIEDGNLSNLTQNGITGNIVNASGATLTLTNTDVSFNGVIGALFNVEGGSTLNFNIPGGANFFRNGSFGVFATVDGFPSVANFNFVDVVIEENGLLLGGDGFNVAATNGAVINASFTGVNSAIIGNADQGVEAIVNSGASATYIFENTNVDNNGLEGLLMTVDDAASTLIVTATNASFSNNGATDTADNVNAQITGGYVDMLFTATNANSSSRSGFNFDISDATGPTSVMVQLNEGVDANGDTVGTTANDNINGNGVRFVATGPTTGAHLLMRGANEFNDNGNTAPTLPAPGNPGSGVYFEADDVFQAAIRFAGSASNNGNPANTLLQDQDGITIDIDTAQRAAVEVNGPGNVSGNAGDGIDISLVDVAAIQDLTLFTQTGLETVRGLALGSSLIVGNNGGRGVSIVIDGGAGGAVFTGDIIIDGVTSAGNQGDGILLSLTNVSGTPNLTFTNNQIGGNTGHGFNLDLEDSPLNRVNILNNSIGEVQGGGGGVAIDDSLPLLRAGFNGFTLAANDDGSTGLTPIGFNINFFGQVFSDLFVNNNGNVTFNAPLGTFTPFPIVTNGIPMLAPFFADVDTRSHGSPVTYGTGTVNGRPAFGVNWIDVDYFSSDTAHGTQLNDFQLVIIDRSDVAAGDFDLEFNYGDITWETGDASGGTNGLGGSSARVGFTNGTTNSVEFAGSGINGAFLNSGPALTSLVQNQLNSINPGRYIFFARGGGFGGAASPNGGDGIHIEQVNSSFNELVISGNTITENGGSGVNFAVVDNSNIVAAGETAYVTNNNITNNGGNGFRIVNPDVNEATLNISFEQNTVSGNGETGILLQTRFPITTLNARFEGNQVFGHGDIGSSARGIDITTTTATDIISDMTNNLVNNNASDGINIQLASGGTFTGNQFWGNTISGNGVRNGTGMGVRLNGPGGAAGTQIVWNIGDSTQAENFFGVDASTTLGNQDAGIGILLTTDSEASIRVQNTTILGVNNGTDANFDGDGFAIVALDSAIISNLVIGTDVNGPRNTVFDANDSDGISIFLSGSAQMANPGFFNIGGSQNGQGIGVTDGSALRIERQGTAVVDNVLIAGNDFNANDDGMTLIAAAAPLTDEYTILENNFNNNGNRGVHLRVEADAFMFINMQENVINGNANQGILMTEEPNANTDIRDISGVIRNNDITVNGAQGIQVTARHGNNGDLLITQNRILSNTDDGIEINRLGFNTISLNTITGNGGSGVNINAGDNIALGVDFGGTTTSNILNNLIASNDKGIELTTDINDTVVAIIQGNTIINNIGDGIEVVTNGSALVQIGDSAGGVPVPVAINTIADNGGRGVDILTRQFGLTDVSVLGNNILRNGEEGIYVVNTPTDNQDSDAAANVAMQTTTNFLTNSITVFTADANQIRDNGSNSTFDATGIVVRVGTQDSSTGAFGATFDQGGFVTNGPGGDGVFDIGDLTFRGGVAANVTNNVFSGQFGNDVTFESFVGASTIAPTGSFLSGTVGQVTQTAGTWTDQNENPRNPANDVFTINTYVTDPLARFDLNFSGNIGLALDVTRTGAAYDNAEDIFKSRTQNQDNGTDGGADDNGPFGNNDADRRRNAQRLAARDVADFPAGGQLDPQLTIFGVSGNSDNYLFPGMGTSTFRVTGTTNTAGFTLGDTFILDNTPFDQTTFDSNGVFYPGINVFGENPFGWSLIP